MKSIFSRLILSFLAIILIVIFSTGILFSKLLRNYMVKQKETELRNKGSQIVQMSKEYFINAIDENTFSYTLNSIDDIVNSQTFIIDRSGIIVISPAPGKGHANSFPSKGTRLESSDITNIFKGSTIIKNGYNPIFKETMITVGIPIYDGNINSRIIGAVILNSPVNGITEAISKTSSILIFACLAGLGFSLIAAYALSKTLSNPIRTISKAALEIAHGDYSKKVDINRKDEIGILSSSFNYLTEKLNETIGDLNNEKSKLSDILYSMEEGLLAVDTGLNIIQINPAASNLLNLPEQSAPSLSDLSGCKDMALNVGEVLKEGMSKSFQKTVGENKFLNVLVSPLKYQNDETYGAIIILQDISESMKLEKMRRDFVANVSHELRTPLTSIRGFIEPLIDGTVNDRETSMKYHNIIRSETLRLERLINDLLDLSRLQSGKVCLDIQKVNIVELITNISNKFQPIFDSKGIKFKFKLPGGPVFILADGDRIEQLMVIFIDNAVKFTPTGGSIEINLAEDDDIVRISVKDTGVGIPKEDIPYIWERFYKVDKSRTSKSSGTGLGLSIAKNIVELHNQKVLVESTLGKGTTFEFTMKRAK